MTRTSLRPMASVGLVAAVLVYVGCAKTRETTEAVDRDPAGPVVASPAEKVPEKAKGNKGDRTPKFIEDWSARPPAGVLLISGEQDGYPDPCGCTDGQLGGLGRRYHLVEMLRAKGWPLAKVDLGSLIHNRGDSRGGPVQEKIKYKIILQALAAMKYDGIALGPEDLKLGILETLGELLNQSEPKYLSANLTPTDTGFASVVLPYKVATAGPITIGVTAVIEPSAYEDLKDQAADLLAVKPPDDVLSGILEKLKAEAKVKVLMVQGSQDEAKRLASKFPGFDIVVGTSLYADPDEKPEMVNDGKTLLITNLGKKGKHVGVVGFFPGETPMFRFRRQSLDADHFTQAEPMRVLIDHDYQEMLKSEKVVENFPRFNNPQAPAGAAYIGAQACQACHPKTFEKWTTTKHAKAYDALTSNPKRNREFDAECISCHTTGFGYNTGWVSAEKTPLLKGNQCENCHGPGSKHAAEPDNLDFRKPMAMTAVSANKTNFCTKCHDEDNDHNFTFDGRYAQIFHKGFDTYEDPKVHQGIPARPAGEPK